MIFKRRKREIYLHVYDNYCVGCGNCVKRCRHKVFSIMQKEGKNIALVQNLEKCVGCGKCQKVCDAEAIELIVYN